MFIPIHDANHLRHIRLQYVTLGLIATNVLVWLLLGFDSTETRLAVAVTGLGFIPAVANDFAVLAPELVLVPDGATYVTHAFLHADILHLGGNMLFLWVFGDNVEDALGHFRFLVFYLIVAAAGAYVHALVQPFSEAPLIGASGAASGIVAAYLMLHPRVRLWVLAFGRLPLPLPAYVALLLWIGFQFVMLVIDLDGQVSWAAHAGGIVAGALLVIIMRRRGVPLFDRKIVTPRAVETSGVPRVRR